MRVSIVIPCYNHARFLGDALASALAQTVPCEVIVVDDGSTDGSGRVARGYGGALVIRQPNRGLAAARNAGFRASSGEVVIFLDADDRLWPHAAWVASATFAAHPRAAMIVGRCRLVNETGVPQQTSPPPHCAPDYEALLRDNCIWTPAVAAFRRSALEMVGLFDEANSPAADYDLYLRIARQFSIVGHSETVVDYRQHAGNMSRDAVLMLESTLKVLQAQRPWILGNEAREDAYRESVARWRACYGERLVERFREFLHDGDVNDALTVARHLLRLYPAGVRQHMQRKLSLMVRRARDNATVVSERAPS